MTDALQTAFNKAKIDLLSRPDSVFFTTVFFSLKHKWDTAIPTACTNGKEIRFNPDSYMALTPGQRVSRMLHETLHVALLHFARLMDRNPEKWNVAADYYINNLLISRGFERIETWLVDPQYDGLSTEEIYDKLPDNPPMPKGEVDLEPADGDPVQIQQDVQDIIVRAALQSKMQGDTPGSIPGEIQIFLDKLLNPKLPWQRILQKYMRSMAKNDYSFRRPNRRFFPKHYLPSLYSESLMDIAIAVDTSGSVTDNEFLHFISEINSILRMQKPSKLTLLQFDTGLKAINEIRSTEELSKVVFTGRGGTRIEPVLEWADINKPQLLLVFSDGHFRFYNPDFKANTVWLIHDNERFDPPFGKTIHYHMET